jgi:phosphohistidine phosphatase
MIRVYLVRHGISEDPVPGQPDESRPLTPKGRKRFRRTARAFAGLEEEVHHLLTSPLVRAVQTAEILARAIKQDEVGILEELRSGAPVPELLSVLAARIRKDESVALVGHDPQMSRLVVALARLVQPAAGQVEFDKGAIVRIDVDAFPPRKSEPRWHLRPRSREIAEGLPLTGARRREA